ncbi:MAG: DUF3611 family protein [Microcystaceae cyanobacterium]
MEKSLGRPLPIGVQKASSALQIVGNIGFWVQLILGVLAAVLLLLSAAGIASQDKSTPGTGFSIFCAMGGVIALAISIVLFFRYKQIAKLMRVTEPEQRPKRSRTLQLIKFGILTNLIGMLLSILGAEAFVGIIWGKLSNISPGTVFGDSDKLLVTPNEILLVLANTHTILCHAIGLAIALWLLERLNKVQSST